MTTPITLLRIATDEAQTLVDYQTMIDETPDITPEVMDGIHEIMGDEFNHCLISLLMAAKLLGIHIATDDISPDPNDIEVS